MLKSKPLEFLNNQLTELDNINNMNNLNDLNNQQHYNDLNNQQINDNINNQRNHDDANNQPILNDVNNQNDKQIKYKHIHDILYKLYFTDKNFDGIDQLLRKAKVIDKSIKRSDVKLFLESTKAYQMTYTTIKEKTYPPIYSERPYAFQIDLSFIPQYKEQNKGIYVLFTAININTRYSYASYATNKEKSTVLKLFQHFQKQVPEINMIMGDLGSEFTNTEFLTYLDKQNISYHFFKSDSHKLGIINRFHRTLKEKILKYMIANETTVWYDILDTIINNYNHTYHRGIKMQPAQMNNYLEQLYMMQKRNQTNEYHDSQPELKINDIIRVKNDRNIITTRMEPIYGYETYQITKINKNTVKCIDPDEKEYTFKKDKLIVVNPNDFVKTKDVIKDDKKINTITRKIKKENFINEPVATRLRTNRTKNTLYNDYIT